MISLERLSSIDKQDMLEASKTLQNDDLKQLVEWLAEKDDNLRYHAFQLLQHRSTYFDDVYPFWETFYEKLKSENSYQRSIGLMLIAENIRWDRDHKFDRIINEYLSHVNDEKPITVRQCIQSLQKIIPFNRHSHAIIADRLMKVDLSCIKETMRKLVLLDILNILISIRKYQTTDEIEGYIFNALNGGLLDKKTIKQMEAKMG